MTNLPEMIVENNSKRKDTSHWLKSPSKVWSEKFLSWLQDTLSLVELAKIDWPYIWEDVATMINKYSPVEIDPLGLSDIMKWFGISSWFEAVQFVKDDECVEFMVKVAHYCKRTKTKVRKDRDFIDWEWVWLYARRADRTDRGLEKTFDAKYHFKQKRPLEYLNDTLWIDCSSTMNYVHPWHYAFPAWHGYKFFETVDISRDTWELSPKQDHEILVAAIVLAMARSWWWVHYPEDNLASGYFAWLKEFRSYWE